jgi:hypothetical protein
VAPRSNEHGTTPYEIIRSYRIETISSQSKRPRQTVLA